MIIPDINLLVYAHNDQARFIPMREDEGQDVPATDLNCKFQLLSQIPSPSPYSAKRSWA
jgi:hypothetical protein